MIHDRSNLLQTMWFIRAFGENWRQTKSTHSHTNTHREHVAANNQQQANNSSIEEQNVIDRAYSIIHIPSSKVSVQFIGSFKTHAIRNDEQRFFSMFRLLCVCTRFSHIFFRSLPFMLLFFSRYTMRFSQQCALFCCSECCCCYCCCCWRWWWFCICYLFSFSWNNS